MRYSKLPIALIMMTILTGPCCGFAATSAELQLSATVLPFVSFNAVQHVASYRVNSDDIKKGYVDLPNSVTVKVRTNLGTGVPVTVENSAGGNVLIRESGGADFQGNMFTMDTAGHRPNTPISRSYDFRILLSADAKDGTYPLAISMAPAI